METSDQKLIEKFLRCRDASAFELLVQKFGPMVRNVCGQILRNSHDIDDAFQATFIVFAKKAHSIRKKDSIGSWLYGVALRTALRLKSQGQNRTQQELEAASMQEQSYDQDPQQMENIQMLHKELDELPEKYRAPIVLCYLNGKSYQEAASELKLSYDETRGKLERGRELLRERLGKRGVVYTSVTLAAVLSTSSNAAVPATLIQSTSQAAMAFTGGKLAAAGVVSKSIEVLTREVLEGIFMEKLKMVALSSIAALAITGSTTMAVHETQEAVRNEKRNAELRAEVERFTQPDAEKERLRAENEKIQNEIDSLKNQLAQISQPQPTPSVLGDLPSKVISAKIFNHQNGDLDDEIVTVLGLTPGEKAKLSVILKTAKLNLEQLVKSKTVVKEKMPNKVVLEIQPYRTEEVQIKKDLRPELENILGKERTEILYDIGKRAPSDFHNFIDIFKSLEPIQQITFISNKANHIVTEKIEIKCQVGGAEMELTWDPRSEKPQFINSKDSQIVDCFKDFFPEAMK